jgi:hypothetical protein
VWKPRVRCPVDIRSENSDIDRHIFCDIDGPVDPRRYADVFAHVVYVQRQMPTNESSNLVAVIKALNCVNRTEDEQAAKHHEDRE